MISSRHARLLKTNRTNHSSRIRNLPSPVENILSVHGFDVEPLEFFLDLPPLGNLTRIKNVGGSTFWVSRHHQTVFYNGKVYSSDNILQRYLGLTFLCHTTKTMFPPLFFKSFSLNFPIHLPLPGMLMSCPCPFLSAMTFISRATVFGAAIAPFSRREKKPSKTLFFSG